jgi:hypothetical protein
LEKKAGLARLPAARRVGTRLAEGVGKLVPGSASRKMHQTVTSMKRLQRLGIQ